MEVDMVRLKKLLLLLFILLSFTGCHKNSEATKDKAVASEEKGLEDNVAKETHSFHLSDVPQYFGEPYVIINNGNPFFDKEEYDAIGYEKYSDLDGLGRCGEAFACVTPNTMPTEPRGEIGNIEPSGWQLAKYDILPDNYLYNRCHLIAFQLAGENDNVKNLITGTRYMNVDGMLAFENKVADYVTETGNPVLYRVTPCFEDKNLVASGVLMEARSEDRDISFCIYCYNVQPGIDIDYSDGSGEVDAEYAAQSSPEDQRGQKSEKRETDNGFREEYESNRDLGETVPEGTTYVFNTNTGKFHRVDCDSVGDMKPKNTECFDGTREEAIERGYSPCGRCNP